MGYEYFSSLIIFQMLNKNNFSMSIFAGYFYSFSYFLGATFIQGVMFIIFAKFGRGYVYSGL